MEGDRPDARRWRLFAAVNSSRLRFPVVVSLGGVHLLVGRWFASGVSDPAQVLAFELAEPDPVLGVGVEVKDGPDEREAAGLAGEAADHLGAAFDLGQRALEQVGIRYERA
jgi:hypothetical protein